MNYVFEINNINQLIGLIANVISIIGISGIGVFIFKKINVNVTYNNFYNSSLKYSSKRSNEFKYPGGVRSSLHIKIK